MRQCEFCGRASGKRKFCSQFCSDAFDASQIQSTDLGKNQLIDWIKLEINSLYNHGYKRKKHL